MDIWDADLPVDRKLHRKAEMEGVNIARLCIAMRLNLP